MKKSVLTCFQFFLFTLVLAACADSTLPDARAAAGGEAAHRNVIPLEPVVVVGQCDPYTSLDWCSGGDTCVTSAPAYGEYAVQGCGAPGPGGPGPGGPGGGYTGGSGGGSSGGGSGGTKPKDGSGCPGCGERAPTTQELSAMQAQLSTIQCTDVRNALSAMLNSGQVLVYEQDDGRYAGWDSRSGTIFISRPRHWLSSGLDQNELADSMVHEGVHKMLGHVYGQTGAATHGQDFNDKMAACGFPQGS